MNKVNTVTLKGSAVPEQLHRLHQPPKQLFVKGDLPSLMLRHRIAVVGSRKASPYGRAVTSSLVSDLVRRGTVIVSGLALGVDSIAHNTCVQQAGATIAVLPSPLDAIYPRAHAHLAQSILDHEGALVTEYDQGNSVRRDQFIARNRIIAGLAEALLITEAAENSGSLHTARFALELGLPVFAVPGPITSPLSAGTNNLIKAGAFPVTSIDDISAVMRWDMHQESLTPHGENAAEQAILDLLAQGVSEGADIQALSGLTPAVFGQAMTMLELRSFIRPLGADQWSLY